MLPSGARRRPCTQIKQSVWTCELSANWYWWICMDPAMHCNWHLTIWRIALNYWSRLGRWNGRRQERIISCWCRKAIGPRWKWLARQSGNCVCDVSSEGLFLFSEWERSGEMIDLSEHSFAESFQCTEFTWSHKTRVGDE